MIATLAGWLAERDLALGDLRTGRSLEEAYLAITGARGDVDAEEPEPSVDGRPGPAVGGVGRAQPPDAGVTPVRALTAQLRAEVTMMATNGETIFLTLGIPVVFLLFFSGVHVLPTGTEHPVDFLVPGILALAVMSTAMTALGIGTGFERGYGVLKRLGTTPLGRPRLLAAKITAIIGVELVQAAVLVSVGYALGWNPGGPGGAGALVGAAVAAMVLGTIGFGGHRAAAGRDPQAPGQPGRGQRRCSWSCCSSGACSSPWASCPAWLADVAKLLPASALADALHGSLGHGTPVALRDWIVLAPGRSPRRWWPG